MNTRKIILLAVIAVLALTYTFQLIRSGKNAVHDLVLKEQADLISVVKADGSSYTLSKKDDEWFLAENVKTESYVSERIADNVQKVRVLGTVSAESRQKTAAERFGFDEKNLITVTAAKNGKTLRTLYIGKTAETSAQTYIRIDKDEAVLLASSDLRAVFDRSEEELTAKENENDKTADADESMSANEPGQSADNGVSSMNGITDLTESGVSAEK